jgi:hypothetical protein
MAMQEHAGDLAEYSPSFDARRLMRAADSLAQPLTSVIGYAQLLLASDTDRERRLKTLEQEATRLRTELAAFTEQLRTALGAPSWTADGDPIPPPGATATPDGAASEA